MADFISDEEMAKLEGASAPAQAPQSGFISDEEMSKLEATPPTNTGLKNPRDVDWLGAVKDTFTKGLHPEAQDMVVDNPLVTMAGPVSGAATKALSASRGLLEHAATSPIPARVADSLNVTGQAKGLVGKVLPTIKKALPESAQTIADTVSGFIGRKAAYSNPLTGIPQGISDTARLAEKGQKALGWALDKAPKLSSAAGEAVGAGATILSSYDTKKKEKDGKSKLLDGQRLSQSLSKNPNTKRYADLIQNAASRGQDSLAATHFILSQSEPDYQQATESDDQF